MKLPPNPARRDNRDRIPNIDVALHLERGLWCVLVLIFGAIGFWAGIDVDAIHVQEALQAELDCRIESEELARQTTDVLRKAIQARLAARQADSILALPAVQAALRPPPIVHQTEDGS